ncbi:MAG: HD domain-containing phosphohydrolase [Burkholderiales bacterium]
MERIELPVEKLIFGMYVAELDRPWVGTPFPFQGFVLRNKWQLETLGKFCQRVFVDRERSDALPEPNFSAPLAARHAPAAEMRRDAWRRTHYVATHETEEELPRAERVLEDVSNALLDYLNAVRAGEQLDAERLKGAINEVAASIKRNPDAMLLLARLHRKGTYELIRALDSSVLMVTFGRFLQLTESELELLGLAGLLQDIGKVRLPRTLLGKKAALSEEERALAQKHVELSMEIVRSTAGLRNELPDLISLHHERYDGSGYPQGLSGQAIGLLGSIAGIVDVYSALTSERGYAVQESPSNALGLLHRLRGTEFQDAIVEQFIQCVGIYPVGSVVELNSGEIGIVIAQNRVRRLQPRVMVILDAKQNPLQPQRILDLIKEPKMAPDQPYRIRRTLEASKLKLDPREFFL